jgi:putative phosphoribosyl transferase
VIPKKSWTVYDKKRLMRQLMDTIPGWNKQTYQIPIAGGVTLEGFLNIPEYPCGVIVFAHGSGSSRYSPRNQFVARLLHDTDMATMLVDLLTVREEEQDQHTGHLRFNIDLLGERVAQVTDWLTQYPATKNLDVAYFGASTGAAAALAAATQHPRVVRAIVSRGGRPDLAKAYLDQVPSPTLLIIGEKDVEVIALNRMAYALLHCPRQIEIVPEATHLFEEPGALEQVARLAGRWFMKHLSA